MAPRLYLVRHAHASDAAEDAARRLSHRGHEQLADVARCLKAAGVFEVDEVWHSPLVRARETAEVIVDRLDLKARLVELAELTPEAAPALVARRLQRTTACVAVVGHEPHLSSLASLLVAGSEDPVVFLMKKASVLALEMAGGGRWAVRWHISPEILG